MDSVVIQGVELRLTPPDDLDWEWVGRPELKRQLLAAWMLIDEHDHALSPRLVGKPGVGKTTLAAAAARSLGLPVYVFQATMDTRPEDLLVTPVIADGQKLRYIASPLVSAMITGGVCVLDEGNRMSEKSWASLAPLLDRRRYVESIVAGIKIQAHKQFRVCATMNDDSSTFDIPEYIHSRLQPQILIDFPERDEELAILQANLPFAPPRILHYLSVFLERAHDDDQPYTARDGINIARYALKLGASERGGLDIKRHVRQATQQTLGEEALEFLPGEVAVDPTRDPTPRAIPSATADPGAMSEETAPTYRPAWPDPLSLSRDELTELGLVLPGVVVLPILHGRLEFAWMVRRAIERLTPAALAVEYPESLGRADPPRRRPPPAAQRRRVPRRRRPPVYLPVEPADALVEAVRRGLELGIPVHMVDRDVDRYPAVRDRLPDALAAESAGARAYLAAALAAAEHSPRVPEDDLREHTMAFNVAALAAAQSGPGGHHPRRLRPAPRPRPHPQPARDLRRRPGPVTPLRRIKREGVVVHHLAESASREVLAELPFVNAAYERSRGTAPPSAAGPAHTATVVDLFTRARQRPRIDPFRTAAPPEASEDRPRATGRMGLLLALCQQARARYREQTGETLRPGTLLHLLRYACRYAYLEGGLGPDLYQLVIAARGYADDNYAHEVWEVATHYPWQTSRPELPPLELSLRDLHEHVRSIRFHPKTLQRRHRLMRVIRRAPASAAPASGPNNSTATTSAPTPRGPRPRALRRLPAQADRAAHSPPPRPSSSRSPTNLYDGIDIRETVRNWHSRRPSTSAASDPSAASPAPSS
jgi:MoxR-like ATPase